MKENQKQFSLTNKKLINLKEVGYKGDLLNDSKFIPASVLSAIVLDYTLKKMNISRGLLSVTEKDYLNAMLDGGIKGDSAEPSDEFPDKGFKVLNEPYANAIKYISEIGNQGINLILNSSLEDILSKYQTLKPETENKINIIQQSYMKIDNLNIAAMFLPESLILIKAEGLEIDTFNDVLGE